MAHWLSLLIPFFLAADSLVPGDHERQLKIDDLDRRYFVHVPPNLDPHQPVPVVLVFHGAGMNGRMMPGFCGMNDKADAAGFVAVYPNGTGVAELLLVFNAAGTPEKPYGSRADDVKFVDALLDDLGTVLKIDSNRVYASGFSNGAMLCYRLAAELPDRIAAIAPVSGTQALKDLRPPRPVPILHLHGTRDLLVPWDGPVAGQSPKMPFLSVPETLKIWIPANHCATEPVMTAVPDQADDGTRVMRRTYTPSADGAEIVVYAIEGGGHTWPGSPHPQLEFLGKTTLDISANDLIWDFFVRHPRRAP